MPPRRRRQGGVRSQSLKPEVFQSVPFETDQRVEISRRRELEMTGTITIVYRHARPPPYREVPRSATTALPAGGRPKRSTDRNLRRYRCSVKERTSASHQKQR